MTLQQNPHGAKSGTDATPPSGPCVEACTVVDAIKSGQPTRNPIFPLALAVQLGLPHEELAHRILAQYVVPKIVELRDNLTALLEVLPPRDTLPPVRRYAGSWKEKHGDDRAEYIAATRHIPDPIIAVVDPLYRCSQSDVQDELFVGTSRIRSLLAWLDHSQYCEANGLSHCLDTDNDRFDEWEESLVEDVSRACFGPKGEELEGVTP